MTRSQLGAQDIPVIAHLASQLLLGFLQRAVGVSPLGSFANTVTMLLSMANTCLQTGHLAEDGRVAQLSL